MSTSLVFRKDHQLFTSSEIIAAGANIQHKNVLELIRKYPEDFAAFGPIAFETRKGKKLTQGGFAKSTEIAILNEQQATLLFTYFRNTEIVRRFKIALVKTFYEMRQALQNRSLPPAEQLQIRQAVARRAKTSAIAYQTIYRALYERFQIAKYDQLNSSDLQAALDFIATCDVKLPALPAPEIPEGAIVLEKSAAEHIRTFIYYWRYFFRPELEMILRLLQTVQSPMAPRFWEAVNSMNLSAVEAALAQHGYPVKDLECYKYWNSHR